MKRAIGTVFLILFFGTLVFSGIAYTDNAIRRVGFSEESQFATYENGIVTIDLFGKEEKIDLNPIKNLIEKIEYYKVVLCQDEKFDIISTGL